MTARRLTTRLLIRLTRWRCRRSPSGPAAALLGGFLLMLAAGCARYPEMSGSEGIYLIAALRTACSSQRDDRLQKVIEAADKARAAGELNEAQYEAFERIFAVCREKRWKEAERMCLRFQQDQVR